MNIDQNMIEQIVNQVLDEMEPAETNSKSDACASCKCGGDWGVFEHMNDAIEAADKAWHQYLNCSMADRTTYVQAIRDAVLSDNTIDYMSEQTVLQTGMGNVEAKRMKNRLAATNTPGTEDLTTEAWSGDAGLTLVEYSPFGVIGAICPTTNPTETIINNSIGMLAAGNAVVFSPHPRAKEISLFTVRLFNQALARVGAPRNLVVTVADPSIENTNIMMNHEKVRMLVATGGPGIVKAVLSTGKKAIGAGAGNPPVVVDETADIAKAAKDIIDGNSFDNNLPCTAEKECLCVDSVADYLIFEMQKHGAYLLSDPKSIEALVDLVTEDRKKPKTDFVGKSAPYLLEQIGIKVSSDIRSIIVETDEMHPFVQIELMMPILPIVRVDNVDDAIDMAVRCEHGCRHTAMMHSKNVDKLTLMAQKIQTTIFVKNGPNFAGLGAGGMGYATFTIAGPTGEGLTSAKSFCRKRRCVLVGEMNVR